MRKWLLIFSVFLFLAGCGNGEEAKTEKEQENQGNSQTEIKGGFPQLVSEAVEGERLLEMKTNLGTITIKLFPDHAPKAVENFITHSEEGYYDGVTFHRVIPGFMIQGGDPEGTGSGGESIYGEPFENEISPNLYHLRGALSMANAGPDTNGSQFFIVQSEELGSALGEGYPEEIINAYESMGGTPWLDGKHTVFGQVVKGMEVVDKIASVETQSDKPVEDVIIESVTVLQ